MRLCLVVNSFHPEVGGPSRYFYALARALAEQGHRPSVITTSPDPAGHAYPFPVLRVSRRWPVPLRIPLVATAVAREARRSDLLCVSDYGLPAALGNLFAGCPSLIKVVGDFAWEWGTRHGYRDLGIDDFQAARHPLKIRLVQRLQRWYVGRHTHVLTPSHYLKRIVTGWGMAPDRVTVIPNAVYPEHLPLPPDRNAARRETGIPAWNDPANLFLLSVGRLVPWKGFDAVLRVMKMLPPCVHLAILGEGPEEARLRGLVADLGLGNRVHLVGRVPQDRVGIFLRASDLFVLFTGYEGMSHVLLEALAAGCAVVTTGAGGNPELIRDGENGRLVPYGDENRLLSVLRDLVDRPGEREALSSRAPRLPEEYTWPRLMRDTVALLSRLARRDG